MDGRAVHVIAGVPDVKIATDHLYTAAALCTPKLPLSTPERLDVDGVTVLSVTVPEGLAWIIHEHFCLISSATSSCIFILLGR